MPISMKGMLTISVGFVLASSLLLLVWLLGTDDTEYVLETTWRRVEPNPRDLFTRRIPNVIWQTVKSHRVPRAAYKAGNSWTRLNPTYDRIVLDDVEVLEFVEKYYNQTEVELFKSMPVGVMKADFFRYMVVYIHGGVYADADTRNHRAINWWVNPDCEFVVGVEGNGSFFCQWAFAAAPRHAILKLLVEKIFHKLTSGLDFSSPHFVHGVTGPAIFTDAIREALGISNEERPANIISSERGMELRKEGICWFTSRQLGRVLSNMFAHERAEFRESGWSNWFEEAEKIHDEDAGKN
eukprot:CAMPEP_0113956850 /NCGR_PEP_ID=MMETSP0011_2-20120614/2333_1 /TAXON_ID=101924 /ORGANISM="Rhodosorus marinus" /LENGTH=295 /DNA_ID=CAMNT_0000967127 /DNA_START=122 /DNA_END=1009 /DNA_ORIENTATION=- /assembly_acc=CAM_ASM_000156